MNSQVVNSKLEEIVKDFLTIFFVDLYIRIDNENMSWRSNKDLIFDYNIKNNEFWICDKYRFLITNMFQMTDDEFNSTLKNWSEEKYGITISSIYDLPF